MTESEKTKTLLETFSVSLRLPEEGRTRLGIAETAQIPKPPELFANEERIA